MSQLNVNWFYKNDFTVGAAFDEANNVVFGDKRTNLKIIASASVAFSLDRGATVHGDVVAADGPVDFFDCNVGQIVFKGTGTVRVWAWDGE